MTCSSCVALARALVGEEQHGLGERAGIGERVGRPAGGRAVERLDPGVDDQQGDVDPVLAQLERGGVGERADAEGAGSPEPAAGHRTTRRPACHLDHRRRAALAQEEADEAERKLKADARRRCGPRLEGLGREPR